MALSKSIQAVYSVLWCWKHCSLGGAKPEWSLNSGFPHPKHFGGRSHWVCNLSEFVVGCCLPLSASAFLHHRDAPPLLPSDTTQGYRTVKAKLGSKKVRPWKWMPFTNPARKDGAMFYHWRRAAEEGKDYPFARFNKVSGSTFEQKHMNSSWKIPFCQLLECPDRKLVLSTSGGWVTFGNFKLQNGLTATWPQTMMSPNHSSYVGSVCGQSLLRVPCVSGAAYQILLLIW